MMIPYEKSPELMTLSELCNRLECRHFHLAEILHGLLRDCPDSLKERFGAVVNRVLAHLREEGDTLFPLIRELDRAGAVSGAVRAELGRRLKAMRLDLDGDRFVERGYLVTRRSLDDLGIGREYSRGFHGSDLCAGRGRGSGWDRRFRHRSVYEFPSAGKPQECFSR